MKKIHGRMHLISILNPIEERYIETYRGKEESQKLHTSEEKHWANE